MVLIFDDALLLYGLPFPSVLRSSLCSEGFSARLAQGVRGTYYPVFAVHLIFFILQFYQVMLLYWADVSIRIFDQLHLYQVLYL